MDLFEISEFWVDCRPLLEVVCGKLSCEAYGER